MEGTVRVVETEEPERVLDGSEPDRGAVSTHRPMTLMFTAASFLGSFLLFLIQPIAAKFLLPVVGGSTALWNTALVFFQGVLLVGYLFAHGSTTVLGSRRHPTMQLLLLLPPLIFLPIGLPLGWSLPPGSSPSVWVLSVLAVMVGLPFFALSTSSPTLQRWLSWTNHPDASDPYFLYSSGNVGSVLALVSYPLVLEPILNLSQQARLWSVLYVLYIALVGACVLFTRKTRSVASVTTDRSSVVIAATDRVQWVLISAVPAALLLGVTQYLSVDIAPFPLLWVVPLLLYLMTFVIVFKRGGPPGVTWARRLTFGLSPVVALSAVLGSRGVMPLWLILASSLLWFFAATLVLHTRLAVDRPDPSHLTEFFAWISVGGALGGTFVSLVAPLVFTANIEFALAVGATLLLASKGERPILDVVPRAVGLVSLAAVIALSATLLQSQSIMLFLVAATFSLAFIGRTTSWAVLVVGVLLLPLLVPPGNVLLRDRSFFGTYVVAESNGARQIISGTTVHGTQLTENETRPTTYYARTGPLGHAFSQLNRPATVGVVGLGAGAIAAYGSTGDEFVFYEIDPLVVDIAQDQSLFSYLADSDAASVLVEVGDGRALLEQTERTFDLLVIDAFTSDAIPVHLVTKEALEIYKERLSDGGLLMIHISNRHLALAPVIARGGLEVGLITERWLYQPSPGERADGAITTDWLLLAPRSGASVDVLPGGWTPVTEFGPLWTDDFSNIMSVIDW